MRQGWMGLAAAAGLLGASGAAAQSWGVIQQAGGYQVARIETAGNVRGLAVTCEGGVPMLAVRPGAAIGNPAQAILKAGGRTASVRLTRNGGTDVWFAPLRDRAVLDLLAGGEGAVAMAIDGRLGASVPLAGSDTAFAQALKGCYQVAARAPVAPPAGHAAAATGSAPAKSAAAAAAPAGGGVAAADAAAIKGIITRFQRSAAGMDGGEYQIPKTPGVAALEKQCLDLDNEMADECVGGVDPYTGGQDANEELYTRLAITLAPSAVAGMIDAKVTFSNFGAPERRLYRFARTPSGWAVDDMFFDTVASGHHLRGDYAESFANLKKQRRR